MSSDKRTPRPSAPSSHSGTSQTGTSTRVLDADEVATVRSIDSRLGGAPPSRRRALADARRARQLMWRRRRRAILLAVLLMVFSVAVVKAVRAATGSGGTEVADYLTGDVAGESPSPATKPSPSPSATPSPEPTVVDKGDGEWTYAKKPEESQKFGDEGTVMKYSVAVEGGIHAEVTDFAAIVADTLADDRGWIAGGDWRFVPIGKSDDADFTVYLASPQTRKKLCGGANDTYTSCRNGDKVVVNLERWLLGVPHWDESLDSYRQYVVNHEVGHRLGEGHVTCPKKGELSPVMAQQTVELRGCEPNAWPYPDGKYITGPPGEYL